MDTRQDIDYITILYNLLSLGLSTAITFVTDTQTPRANGYFYSSSIIWVEKAIPETGNEKLV